MMHIRPKASGSVPACRSTVTVFAVSVAVACTPEHSGVPDAKFTATALSPVARLQDSITARCGSEMVGSSVNTMRPPAGTSGGAVVSATAGGTPLAVRTRAAMTVAVALRMCPR
jgi:hypothetical protein